MKKIFLFFYFLLPTTYYLLPSNAFAQKEPGNDYKGLERMYDSKIIAYDEEQYEKYAFVNGENSTRVIGGKFYQICYAMPKRDWTQDEILEKYNKLLEKLGYHVIFLNEKLITITAMGTVEGKLTYVEVKGYPKCGDYMFTIVEKGDPPPPKVEEETDADKMAKALLEFGKLLVYGINFDVNSPVIRPSSYELLDQIVMMMQKYPEWNLEIQGHTDNTGTAAYNLKLSQERAESVKKYLVDKGILAVRLTTVGYGDTMPVADNTMDEGRAKNRRVELVKK